jgi:DNA-binding beta-propeller fold protein YncE
MMALNVIGQADFDDGLAIVSQTTLSNPLSVAWDPNQDRLFVGDDGNRVLVYDLSLGIADGMPASTILGQQDDNTNLDFFDDTVSGTTQSNLYVVGFASLEYDAAHDRLFVGDTGNSRVLSFDTSGTLTHGMAALNVLGAPDFDNQADPADVGEAYTNAQPWSMAYSSLSNTLAVADYAQLRTQFYDVASVSIMEEPSFMMSMMRDGLGAPAGIAVDAIDHRLFVTEAISGRVVVYDLNDNNELTNDVPDQVMVHSNFHTLLDPDGIASLGIAYDELNKHLWVADGFRHRVVAFDADPLTMTAGAAPIIVLGQTDVSGTDAYTMNGAAGVAFDSNADRLFVADSDNHRVLVYESTSTIISGAAATYVIGQQDDNTNLDYFDDAVAGTSSSTLNAPAALVYDGVFNRLFVSDANNNRVMIYDGLAIANGMGADNVLGQENFDDSQANRGLVVGPASLYTPVGLTYDAQEDRLLVSDAMNYRDVIYDLSGGIEDGMDAVSVIGQPDLEGGSAPVAVTRESILISYGAVFVDHMLYVADSGGMRLLTFDFGGQSSSSSSPGDIYAPQIYNAHGQSVAETEAQITWDTNEYSTSWVLRR